MTITEASTATGMSRSTIMLWIERGRIKPRKKPTHFTPSGFYYEFSAADIAKLLTLKRPAGRPVGWRKEKPNTKEQ